MDKPTGMTSHDVVARTRRLAGTRKVGHAGTLDPMATGLLVLGINSSTRLLTYVVGQQKEYLATIRLGLATTTDDAEGDALEPAPLGAVAALTRAAIDEGIAALTGDILQRPSSVSAIKVGGKRAYALVRSGENVDLPSRPVTVSEFEIATDESGETAEGDAGPGYPWRDLTVRVVCSSGTYIRALARDLGDGLGVGGHLTALRRTRIGPFRVSDAAGLDELVVADSLLSAAEAAARLFDVIELDAQQTVDLGHGKRPEVQHADQAADDGPVAAVAPDGRLIGLVEVVKGHARVLVNFPPDDVEATDEETTP